MSTRAAHGPDPYTTLLDDAALATAVGARRARDWATIAADDTATLRDLIVHAARSRRPVTISTTHADHHATVVAVGLDSVLFRGAGGSEALVPITAISAVTAPWRRTPAPTDELAGPSFSTSVAELASRRPAVRLLRIGRLDPLVGRLRFANETLCCVEPTGLPTSRTYVALRTIAELWIEP